jgi:Fur family ferric uptake transcriptional regulator
VELEAPTVEEWAGRTAAAHGFTEVEHTVEISGLCAACSARATGA